MPTLTLAISMASKYTRQVRATILEELNKGLCGRGKSKRRKRKRDHMEECYEIFHAHDHYTAGFINRSLLGGTTIVETILCGMVLAKWQ